MNIAGFSTSTVEKMIAYGWIKTYKDLYHLELHQESILSTPGFGPDKYNALIEEIKKSRKCLMYKFLVAIGIPHLGPEAAKKLHQYFYGSMERFEDAIRAGFRFTHVDGISETLNMAIYEWYEKQSNQNILHALMAELEFTGVKKQLDGNSNPFFDKQVVITGSFENFDRSVLCDLLESMGAIVHSGVNKATDYLIYGNLPGSKKIAFAIEYEVTMISEQKFVEMLEQNR